MLGASTVWTTHVTLVIKKFLSTRPNNFKSFENANWTNAVCFFYFCQKEGPQDARNSERKQDGHTSSFATWPSPPPPRPVWNLDFGSWILGFGSWILDLGFRILDFGLLQYPLFVRKAQTRPFRFWILDFGFWILDLLHGLDFA